MGGYGSGSHWEDRRKSTAEQSRVLDVNWLTREGVFDTVGAGSGSVTWSNLYRGESSIAYEVIMPLRRMRLKYSVTRSGENIDYPVTLTTTCLPWGGQRWWFTCPLTRDGKPCERRVGKLYLPPGGRYFGCRHCHDLTYRSCQDSHQNDKLFSLCPAEIRDVGFDPYEALADWRWEKRINRQLIRNEQRRRRRKALNWY